MTTRHRPQPDPDPTVTATTATTATITTAATSRLRVKLTVTRRDSRPFSPTSSCSSQSDLTDVESLSGMDATSYTDRASPSHNDLHTEDSSTSDLESSSQIDDSPSVSSQELPPYPILSPSIPSPSCTTPSTSLASPSGPCADPFAPYRTTLSSAHFLKSSFASFRTALSNPPPDHRARSSSLPFSAASPPPDSEDEDEDYHNSMIGLRRGSVPLPLKKEEEEEDSAIQKVESVVPRFVPGSVHVLAKAWDVPRLPPLKQEQSDENVSTPLEVLPGFVSFTPESDPVTHNAPVKDEPMSAVLPPDRSDYQWDNVAVKPEPMNGLEETVLGPEYGLRRHDADGTRENRVFIDTVVDDIEVLGPESVISREWDAAWSSGVVDDAADNAMDVDTDLVRPCTPLSGPAVFARREDEDLRASPSETLATAPTSISSPPCERTVAMDSDHEAPVLLHPLHSCDPPVVATVIEGTS